MSVQMRKFLAAVLLIFIVFGWVVTIFGAGPIPTLKEKIKLGLDIEGGVYVVMEAKTDLTGDKLKKLMEQTQAVIEQRVNQMGLSEPIVTIEGEKRIRIELPGAQDSDEAIKTIGKTAQLQFMLADGTVALDGSMVKDAGITSDTQNGGYAISLKFNSAGTAAFAKATEKALSGTVTPKIDGVLPNAIAITLDNQIISAPSVKDKISNGEAIITSGTGGFSQDEATNLSALIRGGSLPVALEEVNTSTRTATIGYNAFEMSVIAGIIAVALIIIIMLAFYGIMGVAANIALLLYIILVLWTMVLLGSVLTLPGIGGIILSIGMAVDANVIIFTRIREEIEHGKSLRVSVHSGFKRALNTIIDSHVTTIIASLVLYQLGTGPVKGFALTLMLGIIASLVTATVVTQLFLDIFCESKHFSALKYYGMNEDNTPKFKLKRKFSFIKHRKIFYIISIVIIISGLAVGGIRGYNYGIDFTGGTMMQFDMGKQVELSKVDDTLNAVGIKASELVYAGKNNTEIIIRTMDSLDNEARNQVIAEFNKDFGITEKNVLSVEQFGPSVGKDLRMNALKSVLISCIGMLIYIILRFELKFGIAAVAGVLHDVLIVISLYGIFHVTINNPFIAGILTVLGYSINDTIVIFDRIRENLGIMKKNKLEELLDVSINETLVRSIMTSSTVLVVMIPLFVLTSNTIREFMLPLFIGVVVGTMSSIFMCSPIYYDLCQLSGGTKYKGIKSKKAN
ncbi:protein translocase subunit SecD [Clostridium aminobutyricum]|uniref:Multifunctional fusion protein n=1 Tax=Clostridium aminobutyricum TaxID=33953 RepID=A0A939IHV6_CLOAM|nr:protein translocase subunit SecD [Clostridium aminobutyricum]MBN7772436.1 protein translocase subunit SecF [Clostridium aminobutyricum]